MPPSKAGMEPHEQHRRGNTKPRTGELACRNQHIQALFSGNPEIVEVSDAVGLRRYSYFTRLRECGIHHLE